MKHTSVSIIIPAYNERTFLGPCLEALTPQLLPGDEVLVVDNNSTDNTVAIASSYTGVIVLNEKKQGQVFAQALGFNAAKNEVLARIDADSIVAADWLERTRAHFKEGAEAVTGPGVSYDLVMQTIPAMLMGFWTFTTNKYISGHYPLWGSNFAVKKSVWAATGSSMRGKQDVWEDFELGMILHDKGFLVQYDRKLIVGYSNRSVDIRNSISDVMLYQFRAPKTYWLCGRKAQATVSFIERTIMIIALAPFFILEITLQTALAAAATTLQRTQPIIQRLKLRLP